MEMMVDESAVLLADQFERLGIEIRGWPKAELLDPLRSWRVDLVRRASSKSYELIYRPRVHFGELVAAGRHLGLPLLVVGDRVSERSAMSLREAGIQYLDAVGNAHIEFGDVLIDIRGRRPLSGARPATKEIEKPSNLFSSRRARVICAVLAWPELVHASVRDIASTAGVSAGLAHDSLELLERDNYLDNHPRRLRRRSILLDYWTAAYPYALGPSLALAQFAGDIAVPLVAGDQQLYVSGESAVSQLLRPASLTIYTDEFDPRLPIVNRWRTDARPNIFVRKKFWTPPFGTPDRDSGLLLAPWPLVYADLMAAGDSRQAEAARALRDEHAPG